MSINSLQQHAKTLFDIDLTDHHRQQFERLLQRMLNWHENRANLTAITDWDEMVIRHILDSLSLLPHLPEGNISIADVGAGAGLPGLPLAIIRPELDITFIESVGKKTDFIRAMATEFNLPNIIVSNERAEALGQDAEHREHYDVVTARALAYMPTLAEYLLPLCKVGGVVIAMKGESADQELEEAQSAIETCGGSHRETTEYELPTLENSHYLVKIDKLSPTPDKYPRRIGVPSKRPLK